MDNKTRIENNARDFAESKYNQGYPYENTYNNYIAGATAEQERLHKGLEEFKSRIRGSIVDGKTVWTPELYKLIENEPELTSK